MLAVVGRGKPSLVLVIMGGISRPNIKKMRGGKQREVDIRGSRGFERT